MTKYRSTGDFLSHQCSGKLSSHNRCSLESRSVHKESFSSQSPENTKVVHCSCSAPVDDALCLVERSSRHAEDNSCWSRNTWSQRDVMTPVVSLCLVDMSDVVDVLDTPPTLSVLSYICFYMVVAYIVRPIVV